jgi:hypothetical protein
VKGKAFFSEEKKQKTFSFFGWLLGRLACRAAQRTFFMDGRRFIWVA